jgi:digeranylgeranylglycerophospholipid reductase
MSERIKSDVVVVGAGVAGLYSAALLGSMGWRVVLVESKARSEIGNKVCGDAIGVHHFRELNLEVPSSVIDHRYSGVVVYTYSLKYSVTVPGEGVSVNRVKFGQWLLKLALDSSVELLDRHSVLEVRASERGVESIRARGVDGRVVEIEARAFIDASGAKPAIRSKVPLEWPIAERPYTTDYNLAYREVLELDKPVDWIDVNYATIILDTNIAPGGYWWVFPKRGDGLVVNTGLGVVWIGSNNPRRNFENYVKPKFPGRVLHAGGGLVPTRRPLPTLVWRNVVVVGDAAYTVNPVHGGGIGSSMLSAAIASKHLNSALEAGSVSEDSLWQVNIDYMRAYGAKQARLDVLRMYMQKLSNEDFEWTVKNRIVSGGEVHELGTKGDLAEHVVHALSAFIRLLGRPSLLNQLRVVRSYMKKISELHTDQYPSKPSEIRAWMSRVEGLLEEYTRVIGYERGPLVKW